MKKVYSIALAVLALTIAGAVAEEAAHADKTPAKHEKEQATQDMTAIGTVTKHENKKKDGSTLMTWYTLTDEEGKEVHLPKEKAGEFVGVRVKVTGTGYITEKKGKTVRTFKTVATIEKADAPAAPVK